MKIKCGLDESFETHATCESTDPETPPRGNPKGTEVPFEDLDESTSNQKRLNASRMANVLAIVGMVLTVFCLKNGASLGWSSKEEIEHGALTNIQRTLTYMYLTSTAQGPPPSSAKALASPTKSPATKPSSSNSTSQLPTSHATYNITNSSMVKTTFGNTTFYAIGDTPYNPAQVIALNHYVRHSIPSDAKFFVHVGDIRNGSGAPVCNEIEYTSVAAILRQSPVPVFVIMGDNDWNDCPNPDEGLKYWRQSFLNFESRYWNHTFNITRQPGQAENFAFRNHGTLFVGLNLVGADVIRNQTEWTNRLTSKVNWTIGLIRDYKAAKAPFIGRVVIFGHINPTPKYDDFFVPLENFIHSELKNQLPILYLNG
jgi:hypothetical protein